MTCVHASLPSVPQELPPATTRRVRRVRWLRCDPWTMDGQGARTDKHRTINVHQRSARRGGAARRPDNVMHAARSRFAPVEKAWGARLAVRAHQQTNAGQPAVQCIWYVMNNGCKHRTRARAAESMSQSTAANRDRRLSAHASLPRSQPSAPLHAPQGRRAAGMQASTRYFLRLVCALCPHVPPCCVVGVGCAVVTPPTS